MGLEILILFFPLLYWCSGILQESLRLKRVIHCFLRVIKTCHHVLLLSRSVQELFSCCPWEKVHINSQSNSQLVLSYFSGLLVCLCSPTHKSSWQCYGFMNCHFHNFTLFSYSVFCASGAFPYLTNIWSLFKVKVKTLSGARLFATMWTVAFQAPLATGLSRWEYWSGVPLPSPGDLPNPGIQPGSPPLQADSAVRATRESQSSLRFLLNVISSLLSWYSQAKWGVFNL